MEPIATVVVPSYNSGHFLKWTLASIAAQTLKNFECIVVDDCSTDTSIAEVKEFFRDPRFQLIRHKMNVGLSGARNTGLRAARGRYVAFLDSDDLMMANSLEVRVATCRWGERASDRFVGAYCGSIQIEESLQTAPPSTPQSLAFVDFVSSNGLCPFNANQPMLRRDILRLSGGFNQALKQAEDFDLWQRILRAGYVFAPAKHCSVTYRKRAGSMIRREPLTHLHTSLSIINSTARMAPHDQADWSDYRMPKPISDYANQKRKIDRIFEFLGMNLASSDPDPIEQLAQVVATETPDFALLNNPGAPVEKLIHKGVIRQTGQIDAVNEAKTSKLIEHITAALDSAGRGEISGQPTTPTIYDDPVRDRPWFSGQQQRFQCIFIPHSAYHVWTISLLAPALRDLGVEFITVDISPEWRDGGVRAAAAKHGVELIGLSEFALGHYAPHLIVTFNDWDPVTRPIVVAAKAAGIRTAAIVEGIQDYDDADVHWRRWAYKTSDVVLLPGDFDRKYFIGHDAIADAVGVPRIETMRRMAPRDWTERRTARVLINSNFSYGVLEEHRDRWLSECVAAVTALGMTPVISRHPGDKGTLFPEYVTSASFYEALETCDVSIQRFASGVLEALSREVGVIYYNPHGEKVDKFQTDPMGAYVLAHDPNTLGEQLAGWWQLHEMARMQGPGFLDHHAGSLEQGAIARCAAALHRHSATAPTSDVMARFKANLEVLDLETRAFSQSRPNGVALFPDPAAAQEKLAKFYQSHKHRLTGKPYRMPMALAPAAARTPVRQEPAQQPSAVQSPLPGHAFADGSSFLRALAGALLRDPAAGSALLANEAGKLDAALTSLPADDPSAAHFVRVRDFTLGQIPKAATP